MKKFSLRCLRRIYYYEGKGAVLPDLFNIIPPFRKYIYSF